MVDMSRFLNVAPPDDKLNPALVVFEILTSPVVLTVRFGVDVSIVPLL